MKLVALLGAVSCLASPAIASAQIVSGPYVSLGAGINLPNSEHYGYNPTATSGQFGHFNLRPGLATQVSVGYGFGNGFRVELEGNFIKNSAHSAQDDFNGLTGLKGAQYTYGALANLLYDIPVGLPVFPYVGGGVGYEYQKLNHLNNGVGDDYSGTRGSFAYDVIAGVSYPIAMVPGLSLTAQYQFMMLTQSRNYLDPAGGATIKLGPDSSHTFTVGLRYQLFSPVMPAPAPEPAAMPMVAPAPVPAETYLVFFNWNKYDLTPRATEIIAQAAAGSKTSNVTTVDVSGYTDTSGTPTYNQGLSLRRAKAVADKLVVDGVPASEISIMAYGETHLLVPTGPGVREPQNRRVEIVLN